MKPTEAQIKVFWEWCGFKETYKVRYYDKDKTPYKAWLNPDGNKDNWAYSLPLIDLNSLFKCAVPKVIEYYEKQSFRGYYHSPRPFFEDWLDHVLDTHEDPAPALFWAIDKVREEDSVK